MTREETIESFKCSNEQAKLRLEVEKMRMDMDEVKELEFYIERDEMAIKALEQEPKTVLYSGDGYAGGYMVYDMAECPNCGYEYEEGDKDWGLPFCPNCGQSLNWESEGDE